MKALVGAFNQEKALVGAFSVIVKTGCGTDGSICGTSQLISSWSVELRLAPVIGHIYHHQIFKFGQRQWAACVFAWAVSSHKMLPSHQGVCSVQGILVNGHLYCIRTQNVFCAM